MEVERNLIKIERTVIRLDHRERKLLISALENLDCLGAGPMVVKFANKLRESLAQAGLVLNPDEEEKC
jgi:hypothetical protein